MTGLQPASCGVAVLVGLSQVGHGCSTIEQSVDLAARLARRADLRKNQMPEAAFRYPLSVTVERKLKMGVCNVPG